MVLETKWQEGTASTFRETKWQVGTASTFRNN
jgi:hypothetical protein